MSVNPVNHWDVLKISAATKGRARRLSAATGHPIHVLTEKLFLHWEDSYIARMTPAEVERYMAGKMTFEEAQRISWRLRKDVLPIPDDPAPTEPPPTDHEKPARVAEPVMMADV